jgi:hypothetical protein
MGLRKPQDIMILRKPHRNAILSVYSLVLLTLFSLAVYLSFRIVFYGQLVNTTIVQTPQDGATLPQFYHDVVVATLTRMQNNEWLRFPSLFSSANWRSITMSIVLGALVTVIVWIVAAYEPPPKPPKPEEPYEMQGPGSRIEAPGNIHGQSPEDKT